MPKPRKQGTRVKKMPIWEEYGELLERASSMAKARNSAGALPGEQWARLRDMLAPHMLRRMKADVVRRSRRNRRRFFSISRVARAAAPPCVTGTNGAF